MTGPEAFLNGRVTLHAGDCLDVLRTFPDASLDTCVCDPPYALVSIVKRFGKEGSAPPKADSVGGLYARATAGFMGKAWDTGDRAFAVEFWAEVYRVLKPGGHVAAFGGTRTYHRLTCAIEDAGFEVRDRLSYFMAADTHVARFMDSLNDEQRSAFMRCMEESQFGGELCWTFGSGFPKSHDVSKGIDAKLLLGNARTEDIRRLTMGDEYLPSGRGRANYDHGGGSAMNGGSSRGAKTEQAVAWEGWGSALKPALEPICLARKPLEGTIAENVLAHGTGALNIGGCRINTTENLGGGAYAENGGRSVSGSLRAGSGMNQAGKTVGTEFVQPVGRWPANVLHDGSDEVVAAFPEAPGQQRTVGPEHGAKASVNVFGDYGARDTFTPRGDGGSAARFFYSAKADSDDRIGSKHPTVKPVDLMRWLVRLVTPPGGTVLDPFAGTGTTGEAAFREGFKAVLVEREEEYRADITRRMALCLAGPEERARAIIKEKLKGKPVDHGPLFGGMDGEAA